MFVEDPNAEVEACAPNAPKGLEDEDVALRGLEVPKAEGVEVCPKTEVVAGAPNADLPAPAAPKAEVVGAETAPVAWAAGDFCFASS